MRGAFGRTARGAALAVLVAAALATLGPSLRGEAPAAVRHDIPFTTAVVTPHVPWATILPGGPIRGFFVPPVTEGRDMVELMQRLSLAPTTVTIDRNWDVNCWGLGDYYDSEHVLRGDRDDFRIVYRYVEEELLSAKPFEVLVIPGLNGWSRYTRKTRDAILRRVSEGAGLVLLHPFVGDVKGHPFLGDEPSGDGRIWEISPLVGVPDDEVSDRGYPEPNREAIAEGQWRARPHPIVEGLDLGLVPSGARGGRFYRYEARGDVAIEAAGLPVVATRTYGQGRVVAFATVGDGFVPEAVDPVKTRTYWDYWEYEYSLLARAVLWAARRRGGPPRGGVSSDPCADGELRGRSHPRPRLARRAGGRGRSPDAERERAGARDGDAVARRRGQRRPAGDRTGRPRARRLPGWSVGRGRDRAR